MSRITPQSRDGAPPAVGAYYDRAFGKDRDPITQPGTATGTPGDWYTTWGRVPGILNSFGAFRDSTLDPKLNEIALMRTGYARQSQFVFSQHCKAARAMGVAEEKVLAIPYWQVSDAYTPLERAILAYVDGMVLEGGRVHDKVFEALKAGLSEEEILMLSYSISMYVLHATTCRALKMEYDNVPERVVEIPRPEEQSVQDWRTWAWADRASEQK